MAGSMDFRLNLLANTAGLQQGMNGAKFAVNALVAAMAAVGVGLSVQGLAQAADSYTNLSARINIATKDGGNFNQAMAGVHQVALATNSNLTTTADLFTRLNTVGKDMGMTQQQALDLTKTVTQAIKIGGGSAEAADGAVTQFIQAMQGGVLRGEEFNSIMEGGYGLAEALARGLGVTTGELRKMAEAGELSSERVVKALQSQSASVQATYDKFPTTISNALQRISTSWEILIGKMDQSNGASATVAQWLVTIADNIKDLDVVLNDIGEGFEWIGSQINLIDTATIETFKSVLVSAYDALKSLANTVGEAFKITFELLNETLGAIFNFNSGVDGASDKTNGLTKFLQALNVAIGFLNDGFKAIGIVANLLTGAFYSIAAAANKALAAVTWGDASREFAANAEAMTKKAEEHYSKASNSALKFESDGKKAWEEISKTQEQKNADSLATSQKTLDELNAQEAKHAADYKAISDQRVLLEQQLFEARKTGNQAAIDLATKGLADLDAKEKAYQAESTKLTQAKIEAAQAVAEATIKSGDAAGQAALKVLNAKLALQGLKAEFDETGKVIVSAMSAGTEAVEAQDDTITKARKGAAALGLDLDVALNRVSEKFAANKVHLDNYANGLTTMGAKGTQATDALYQGWEKWAEKAKNQAEIEAAKQQLLSFEKQGVLSAKQVQIGMEYLDQVNGKIPENISEIEKAYKMLGVTSKEEAAKIADSQMRAFNVIKQSGTASAEQIRTALINMAEKIYASGDAAKTAWYEGQLAANGLSSTVNEAGKQVVSANDQMTSSAQRHASTVSSGATSAYREMGAVAREEAQNSIDAWNEALSAKSEAEAKTREEKSKKSNAVSSTSYTKSYVRDELKKMGYDDAQAESIAQSIFGTALAKDQDVLQKNRSLGGLTDISGMLYQELRKKGLAGYDGSRYIEQALQRYSDGKGQSTMQALAPNVYADTQKNTSAALSSNSDPSKTVKYSFNFNGQDVSLMGNASQESTLNELFRQLETLKKSG